MPIRATRVRRKWRRWCSVCSSGGGYATYAGSGEGHGTCARGSRCVRHVEVVLRMLGVLEAMRRVQEEKRAYENQAPNFMALKILLEYKVGDASASARWSLIYTC